MKAHEYNKIESILNHFCGEEITEELIRMIEDKRVESDEVSEFLSSELL